MSSFRIFPPIVGFLAASLNAGCASDEEGADGRDADSAPGSSLLAGYWEGSFDCSDADGYADLDASLSLEDVGDGEFTGRFEATGTGVYGGDEYPVRVEAQAELELSKDAASAQVITARWTDCQTWVDTEYTPEAACPLGDEWDWDGADELSHSDRECNSTLRRQ